VTPGSKEFKHWRRRPAPLKKLTTSALMTAAEEAVRAGVRVDVRDYIAV